MYSSKPLRRRKPKNIFQKAKHVRPLVLDSNFPAAINELRSNTDGTCAFLWLCSYFCLLTSFEQFSPKLENGFLSIRHMMNKLFICVAVDTSK